MKMIGHQGPGITGGGAFLQSRTQPFYRPVPIRIVSENIAPFNTSADDVIQGTGASIPA